MPDWIRIRRVLVPIVLIVLVLATTMGIVWHHHAGYRTDQCTLCHLAIAPAAENSGVIALVPSSTYFAVLNACFVSRCAADEKPPRAPPV